MLVASFLTFTRNYRKYFYSICIYSKVHVECWRCERWRNKRRKLNAHLITNNIGNENKCTYLEKNNLKIWIYIYQQWKIKYVKRAIDNYRMKHREEYLEYQKAYKRTEAYKERNRDVRMKQFKIFCRNQSRS